MSRDIRSCAAPVMEVKGLTIVRRSDGAPILRDVSLRLGRGEILGLVGESGSGKTTLGLALLGHVRPGLRVAGGHVRFAGEDVFAMPEARLAALRASAFGLVAQNAGEAFNPARRLLDQTIEAALFHGLMDEESARRRALALYASFGIAEPQVAAGRFPHQLSGGQLQRIMGAMALMNGPSLVILDEPTTALDMTTQARVLRAIGEQLRRAGAAALYISHDLPLVARIADAVCVMRRGRIVEQAPVEDILARPRHPYTRALWGIDAGRAGAAPEDDAAPPLLELRGISAGYSGRPVLRDVSLSLRRGRTLALVGESGSGKTTLGRIIAGLLPPGRGEMLLEGRPLPPRLRDRPAELKRRIQFLHQSADGALNPAHEAGFILLRPLRLFHGLKGAAAEKRVTELLRMVELSAGIAAMPARRLSGGQKQRLALARALAAEPDVIVCDEITSALDAMIRHDILALLRRIQARTGAALLFITHDLAAARAIAHDAAVMHEGRIVEAAPCAEVLRNPRSEAARSLLAALPSRPGSAAP